MLLAIVVDTQGEASRVACIKFYAIVAPVLRLFVQLPATCHMRPWQIYGAMANTKVGEKPRSSSQTGSKVVELLGVLYIHMYL